MANTDDFIIRGSNLCKYCGSGGSVVIPEGIKRIDDFAFQNSDVTEVTIPDTVTVIGSRAFLKCQQLTSITIPDSVKEIEWGAFMHCTNLTTVKLPKKLKEIPDHTFLECKSLGAIEIPPSVVSIGERAFESCESLESIVIPDSVTTIEGFTFYKCGGLKRVHIPDSVTAIERMSFSDCTSLTELRIPEHITAFGQSNFSDSPGLADENGFVILNHVLIRYFGDAEEVTVPKDVTSLDAYAFCNRKSIKSLTLPEGLRSIGESAIRLCDGLTSIHIPESVAAIGVSALAQCNGLTSVVLPKTLQTLGTGVFYECKKLTAISVPAACLEDKKLSLGDNISIGVVATEGDTCRFLGHTSKNRKNTFSEFIRTGKWKAYDQDLIDNGPVFKHKTPARLLGSLGRLADPVDLTEECRAQHLEFLTKNAKKLIPMAEELCCPAIIEAMIACGIVNDKNRKAIAKLLAASTVPEIAAIQV